MSRGTLEANTGITEDVVAKFIAKYPDISPDWLLTGRGDMLRSDGGVSPPSEVPQPAEPSAQQPLGSVLYTYSKRHTTIASEPAPPPYQAGPAIPPASTPVYIYEGVEQALKQDIEFLKEQIGQKDRTIENQQRIIEELVKKSPEFVPGARGAAWAED